MADVRRTELAALADVHLQLLPGTDVALYSAMLNHILAKGLENKEFIRTRTREFEQVRAAVAPYTLEVGQKITGVPAEKIALAAELYARGPNTSTLWAMGLTQHATGTDIVASLLNLLLACGMIGRWGAAMLPIRGQNNVQGASDVGAIPFAYTDYRSVTKPENRADYARAWGLPEEALSLEDGLMVTEMTKPGSGVRGLYIMGENPVISDPDVAHAEEWVRGLEFLGVQDLFLTETARWADVVLPGSSFAEKEGTFANTERRIQLSTPGARASRPGAPRPRHPDRPDRAARPQRAITPAPRTVMKEIASVTPSWAGLTYEGLRRHNFGLQYPVLTRRLRRHARSSSRTRSRHPTAGRSSCRSSSCPPNELPDAEYPFVMGTGRQMYHWHTGTMTRRSTGLDSREPVPTVEMNPDDVAELGVSDGETVRITSRRGSILIGVRASDRQARGQVFVPMHYREAAANLLTNPALDPYAKIASFKVSAVRIERA